MTAPELHEVNSLDEAAAYLKIKTTTLAGLARSKKIGYLKSGRTMTFLAEHVKQYVDEHKTDAAPSNPHGLTDRALSRVKGRA